MATATERDNDVSKQQDVYSFTLLLAGIDEITDELENALLDAGCDDALLGIRCGSPYLAFDRRAETLQDAIKSAIKAVESLQARGIPLDIVRVIPPGEDTIETFNAYLRLRRQVFRQLQNMPPEARAQVETILTAMLEHDPRAPKRMLGK